MGFLFFWVTFNPLASEPLLGLLMALLTVGIARALVLPWFGIAAKWIIVGRYKAGTYHLWGPQYIRWWLANQIVRICGRGFFSWHDSLMPVYLRLMGAKVGRGVRIANSVQLGEWDLLDFGDEVALDARVIARPFCVDGGRMLLQMIVMER